jgi:hypothetical protein
MERRSDGIGDQGAQKAGPLERTQPRQFTIVQLSISRGAADASTGSSTPDGSARRWDPTVSRASSPSHQRPSASATPDHSLLERRSDSPLSPGGSPDVRLATPPGGAPPVNFNDPVETPVEF